MQRDSQNFRIIICNICSLFVVRLLWRKKISMPRIPICVTDNGSISEPSIFNFGDCCWVRFGSASKYCKLQDKQIAEGVQ
ncbi:hypothetical protein B0H12DRAFT_321994 [Mycena haematopus]|nr:hypothetical protein B0H12DRAFT_321994 [Mycena haematopus]